MRTVTTTGSEVIRCCLSERQHRSHTFQRNLFSCDCTQTSCEQFPIRAISFQTKSAICLSLSRKMHPIYQMYFFPHYLSGTNQITFIFFVWDSGESLSSTNPKNLSKSNQNNLHGAILLRVNGTIC